MRNALISVNNGTISICGGTMIPAMISQNSNPLAGNRTREKPYAAILASTTVAMVIMIDVMALFRYQRSMPPALSTFTNASNVKCEGIQLIGTVVVSLSGLRAVSTAQARGIIHSTAAMSSTTKAIT